MPRSKEQNEKIREERRQEILAAAIRLFAQNGFTDTSMSAVAKEAGVSHGTVFLYFSTKDDLIRAAVEEPLDEAWDSFNEWMQVEGTPLQRIRHMAQAHAIAFARQESYLRLVQHVIGLRERFPELAGVVFGFGSRFTEALVPLIQEGQASGELAPCDPHPVAWSYFSYQIGLGLTMLEASDDWLRQMARNAVRIFGPLKPFEED